MHTQNKNFPTEVRNGSKSGYKAKLNDSGNIMSNIANLGIKKGQKAEVRRTGEYKGLIIEALSDTSHLTTDYHIIRAIEALYDGDINKAIKILDIDKYFVKYGSNAIHYTVRRWLEQNNLGIPSIIDSKSDYAIDDADLDNKIRTVRNDPVNFPFKVVSVGQSKKGNPVVPQRWLGREFKNGEEFHRMMDGLDWRKGKPPVSYCCTSGMILVDESKWGSTLEPSISPYCYIVCMDSIGGKLRSSIKQIDQIGQVNQVDDIVSVCSKPNSTYMVSHRGNYTFVVNRKLFAGKPIYTKSHNVGLLASRLQKCIRRGPKCSTLLHETVKQLSISPNYNLPDQQFIRISGSRQLLWRSFISIIEDACGYIKKDNNVLDLLDMVLLAIVCNIDPDLQLSSEVVDQLVLTLLIVQSHPIAWNWRAGELIKTSNFGVIGDGDTRLSDSILFALENMPMMYGDKIMLTRCLDLLCNTSFNVNSLFDISKYSISTANYLQGNHIKDAYNTMVKYVSYDMHCCPNILLAIQARIPFIESRSEYTTQYISHFIWENSSKINCRLNANGGSANKLSGRDQQVLAVLQYMQRMYQRLNSGRIDLDRYPQNFLNINGGNNNQIGNNNIDIKIDERTNRLGFLLLFGKKYRMFKPSLEVIIAGDSMNPCRIKKKNTYLIGKERYENEKKFIEQFAEAIYVPKPPIGYEWVGLNVGKKVKVSAHVVDSDDKKCINIVKFSIEDVELNPFDVSKLLKKSEDVKANPIDNAYVLELLMEGLYMVNIGTYEIVEKLVYFSKKRRECKNNRVYDWLDYAKQSKVPAEVWRQFNSKMVMNISISKNERCEVTVGPVDRSGNKTHSSISYEYEGVFIRLLSLLSFIYPNVIEYKSDLKFRVNADGYGVEHMFKSLYELTRGDSNDNSSNGGNGDIIKNNEIKIKTKLWDHQQQTVMKIFDGYTKYKKKGFGDASHVGAGKTLTALSIMEKLNAYGKLQGYSGFLVMVPTEKLYKTWEDEITKHTEGFEISFQEASGDISNAVRGNTILVTTMGRLRDHPISHPWLLVVIDECLTVQNKEALQTEEAWRQTISSKYGVLMMSATFFRSRFDKMFYMLKMLRTGLPESVDFLDTILSETMVCNIQEGGRIWATNINKYRLSDARYKEYKEILKSTISKGNEKAYCALQSFLFEKCDYVNYFKELIGGISGGSNRKILIYSRSKDEADKISTSINDVSRYPDKAKRHVVLSYAEGTFGLNDLVGYDTIVTRIPDPDKVPQMKGRLDRPGQKSSILYMEYIIIEETIEEASLYKLEMANTFRNNHLLPLAEFYRIALKMK
jgi:hypothetical protein